MSTSPSSLLRQLITTKAVLPEDVIVDAVALVPVSVGALDFADDVEVTADAPD